MSPLDKAAAELDHPCKQTCSGWKQGFDKGAAWAYASDEVLALVEACRTIAYHNDLPGLPAYELMALYGLCSSAIQAFEAKHGEVKK